jgi:hypothetical protein
MFSYVSRIGFACVSQSSRIGIAMLSCDCRVVFVCGCSDPFCVLHVYRRALTCFSHCSRVCFVMLFLVCVLLSLCPAIVLKMTIQLRVVGVRMPNGARADIMQYFKAGDGPPETPEESLALHIREKILPPGHHGRGAAYANATA